MSGVAIIGAGIFAREEHLPAVLATPSLSLKAIYSRSQKSASNLASSFSPSTDVYYEVPSSSGRSLDALFSRSDIQAVIIALPITVQPPVIKKALEAGKHVLSEKPIAKDVATAEDLIKWHKNLDSRKIWAVGENLRFVDAIVAGAERAREVGGELVTFGLEMFACIDEDDKFFNTEWRKAPDYQGGFLLDGGVHFVAALRLLLASTSSEIASLTARTCLLQSNLAPVDTVHAILTTQSDRSGTFSVSFGTKFKSGFTIQVVTTNGSVTVTPTEVIFVIAGEGDSGKAEKKENYAFSAGVKQEVEAFAKCLETGELDPRQSAEEALKDLQILEGMLRAGERGAEFKL